MMCSRDLKRLLHVRECFASCMYVRKYLCMRASEYVFEQECMYVSYLSQVPVICGECRRCKGRGHTYIHTCIHEFLHGHT